MLSESQKIVQRKQLDEIDEIAEIAEIDENGKSVQQDIFELLKTVQKEICDICKKEFDSPKDLMLHTSLEHLAETIQFAKNNISLLDRF